MLLLSFTTCLHLLAVMRLNELDELSPDFRRALPPTDSRFRPDMRLMENGDIGVLIRDSRQICGHYGNMFRIYWIRVHHEYTSVWSLFTFVCFELHHLSLLHAICFTLFTRHFFADGGSEEKNRIEVKQRAAVAERKKRKENWKPLYECSNFTYEYNVFVLVKLMYSYNDRHTYEK